MNHLLKNITWHYNEGLDYGINDQTFSLEEANQYLVKVAEDHEPGGGYSKVKFTATFEDGEEYTGRFDVHNIDEQQESYTGKLCFLDYITGGILFYIGENQPVHMTDDQYQAYLSGKTCPKFTDEEKLAWKRRLGLRRKRSLSPMMMQWDEARGIAYKKLGHRSVVLFRLGDFYELFNEDAKLTAGMLDITLTHRNGMPMAGIPVHAVDTYIEKLKKLDISIAIADAENGNGHKIPGSRPMCITKFIQPKEETSMFKELQPMIDRSSSVSVVLSRQKNDQYSATLIAKVPEGSDPVPPVQIVGTIDELPDAVSQAFNEVAETYADTADQIAEFKKASEASKKKAEEAAKPPAKKTPAKKAAKKATSKPKSKPETKKPEISKEVDDIFAGLDLD